jgi:uncharacterized protein (TIGR01569 family)
MGILHCSAYDKTRAIVNSSAIPFSPSAVLAQVIMVLSATGAATATSVAYLGKNGNVHARWNPVCDKFGSFCSRAGIALGSSFIGVALMLALNLLSASANAPRPNVAGR